MALAGPRYELFSLTVAAAVHAMGVALVPRMLVEHELAAGQLVQACAHALEAERAYYLVRPEQQETKPVVLQLLAWLQEQTG